MNCNNSAANRGHRTTAPKIIIHSAGENCCRSGQIEQTHVQSAGKLRHQPACVSGTIRARSVSKHPI